MSYLKKLAFFSILGFSRLQAIFYGSPALPYTPEQGLFLTKQQWFGFRVGYEGDFCLDKSLEPTSRLGVKRVEDFAYLLQQGVLTANFIDRFEVYGSVGEIKLKTTTSFASHFRNLFETDNQFTWGIGMKGILYNFSSATLGADFKYQRAQPHIDSVSQNGLALSSMHQENLRYREWQLGLGLSYSLDLFTPYIGATYNQTKISFHRLRQGLLLKNKTSFALISSKKFGIAVGTSISTGKVFVLNFEARAINEQAFTVAADFRF